MFDCLARADTIIMRSADFRESISADFHVQRIPFWWSRQFLDRRPRRPDSHSPFAANGIF
jgi:hypothetical protein